MTVGLDMKNPYIIPAAMISAAILAGFWMLKPPSESQEVVVVLPKAPNISIHDAAKAGDIKAVKQVSPRPSIDLLYDIEQIMNPSRLTKALAQFG